MKLCRFYITETKEEQRARGGALRTQRQCTEVVLSRNLVAKMKTSRNSTALVTDHSSLVLYESDRNIAKLQSFLQPLEAEGLD